jgi:MraZ protein
VAEVFESELEFSGQIQTTIDARGRIVLPARLRAQIDTEVEGTGFVLAPGLDRCVSIYTPRRWKQHIEPIEAVPYTRAGSRSVIRYLYSMKEAASCDRQGRLLIPEWLLEHAGIERKGARAVTIVGVGRVLEVWAREEWKRVMEQARRQLESNAENLL